MENTTERGATFRIRASRYGADIARGNESSIDALLYQINLLQDLPMIGSAL